MVRISHVSILITLVVSLYVASVAQVPSSTSGGGSSSTPVTAFTSTHFCPAGSCDINSATPGVIAGINKLNCDEMVIPANTSYAFTEASGFGGTATGNFSVGIYQAGTLIQNSAVTVSPPANTAFNVAFSPTLVLTSGVYGICWSSTAASDSLYGSPTGYWGALANRGEANGTYKHYSCANVVSTGTWPGTCGTQTPISTGGASAYLGIILH